MRLVHSHPVRGPWLFAIGVLLLVSVSVVACHGQYAVNIVNHNNEVVVARTSDGIGVEIPACSTRQRGMAYVPGQRWTLTAYDATGHVVYRDDRTLPSAPDSGALIFTVTIPPEDGKQCP
jgi:hypothetical protein